MIKGLNLNGSETVFKVGVLGRSVQELWVADGLENWVRQSIEKKFD